MLPRCARTCTQARAHRTSGGGIVRRSRYRPAYRMTTMDWLIAFAIGAVAGLTVYAFVLIRLFA
jgi:hypothetical protein